MAIPVAKAGANQTITLGHKVYLNAVLSTDTDHDAITAFTWAIVGAPNGSTAALVNGTSIASEFTPNVAGNYVISLVVTANLENSVVSYTTISVQASPTEIEWVDVVGSATIADGGYVGDLLTIARAHVDDAVQSNRLTNAQAGEIYTAMIPAAFQNGIGFAMQEGITESKVALTEAQTALAIRQAKGFDDDAKQKLLKQTLDSWSVAYSVAQDANSIPDTIKVNTIDSITKNAMDSLAITQENDPIGEI